MTEQESRDRIVAQQMLLARECLDDAAAELVPEGFIGPEQAVAFEGLYAQRLDARRQTPPA